MVRQGQLCLPREDAEASLSEAQQVLGDAGIQWVSLSGEASTGGGVVLLLFTLPTLASGRVLETLAEHGFGISRGTLEVAELRSSSLRSRRPSASSRSGRVRPRRPCPDQHPDTMRAAQSHTATMCVERVGRFPCIGSYEHR